MKQMLKIFKNQVFNVNENQRADIRKFKKQ